MWNIKVKTVNWKCSLSNIKGEILIKMLNQKKVTFNWSHLTTQMTVCTSQTGDSMQVLN